MPRPIYRRSSAGSRSSAPAQRGARLHGPERHQGRSWAAARRRAAPARGSSTLPRGARCAHGRESQLGEDLIIGLLVPHRRQRGAGDPRRRPYYEEWVKMFAPLGFVRGLNDEQISRGRRPRAGRAPANLPTMQRRSRPARGWSGRRSTSIEKLMEIQRIPGPGGVNVGQPVGTPQAVILEQLERFAARGDARLQAGVAVRRGTAEAGVVPGAMTQNIYDNEEFFEGYSRLGRSVEGLDGAAEWPVLRALLPDLRGLDVLDLGCGFGWFCRWARQNGAADVLGIDVSERMLARSRATTQDAGDHLHQGGHGAPRAVPGVIRPGVQLTGAALHRGPRTG